jgi:hypothetical protein
MNRRNFLAYIPALGALPYVGSEILKTDSGIVLQKPEPIEVVNEMPTFDMAKIEFHLVQEGITIAKGYCTNLTMHQEFEELGDADNGWKTKIPTLRSVEVQGVVNGAMLKL